MSEEIKFTKEQIDYIKHCGEHFEVLTGGRGHSKTKQIIEQLQQENQQLKEKLKIKQEVIEEVRKYIEREDICIDIRDNELNYISTNELLQILDKGESNE